MFLELLNHFPPKFLGRVNMTEDSHKMSSTRREISQKHPRLAPPASLKRPINRSNNRSMHPRLGHIKDVSTPSQEKTTKKIAAVFPESDENSFNDQMDVKIWSGDDNRLTKRSSFYLSVSKGVEDLEQVVTWLLNSTTTRNKNLEDVSVTYTESAESSYALFHYGDSSSSTITLDADNDPSSLIWDIDNTGFCDSLLEKGEGWDVFPSDFPSPSFNNTSNSSRGSSSSMVIRRSKKWSALRSCVLVLRLRKLKDQRNEDFFKSISKMSTMTRSTPSSQVPIEATSTYEESTSYIDYRDLLEECFLLEKDVAIETLMGLNEFDGHEGVAEEFNEDQFSLNVPLSDTSSRLAAPV